MNHKNDQPDKWEKLTQNVKEIEGKENLSDEQAEKIIDFLKMLAEVELIIKYQEAMKS